MTMTAAQQHRSLGASAEASEGFVIVQVRNSSTAMTPSEARTFVKCLARALFRADIVALDKELEETRG